MSGRRSLSELQAWMVEAICGPDECATEGIVVDRPRLSGAERLGIYRYAYRARLRECLRDDYPVLAATLGERRFEALCDAYIERHPSRSPSLNAFGGRLPDVCADMLEPETRRFYRELATLEWALVEVTHAQTPVPLELGELQRVPAEAWAKARFVPSAAVRLLKLDYPVNSHYRTYRDTGEVPPLPAAGASATVVYRREIALWRMDLEPAMARVLAALLAGEPISAALARVGEGDSPAPEAEHNVMVSFRDWVAGGLFVGIAWD